MSTSALQPLASTRSTRGTKRAATADKTIDQENVHPITHANINKPSKLAAPGEAVKTRFGFRGAATAASTTALTTHSTNTNNSAPTATPGKKRKGEDGNAVAINGDVPQSTPARNTRSAHSSNCPPLTPASALAQEFEPLQLAPADAIANLWREIIMDDATASDCKTALAGKVTAGKFDYKEKIGQLETQLKTLRKVVSSIMKKSDSFLSEASAVETRFQTEKIQAMQAARNAEQAKQNVHNQLLKAMTLLKTTQGQRDALIAEGKAQAASLAQQEGLVAKERDATQAVQAKLDECMRDLKTTMEALDATTAEREEAKKLLAESLQSIEQLQAQLAVVEEEKDALDQTSKSQATQIQRLQKQSDELEKALGEAREQHMELMAQWKEVQEKAQKAEASNEQLRQQLADTQKELTNAREAQDATKRELVEAHAAMEALKQQHEKELTAQKTALTRECETLRSQMDDAMRRNEEESTALKHSMELLQSSKAALTDAQAKSSLELVQLRSSLQHATERSSSLEIDVKKLEGEIALVRCQLEKKNEECFVTVKNFERIQQFHEEQAARVAAEKEALEKKQHELNTQIIPQLEAAIKSTQNNLDSTKAALDARSAELETLRAEHAKQQEQSANDRAEWETTSTALREEVRRLTTEMNDQVSSLSAKNSLLQSKLESETIRADTLARELKSFKELSGVSSESQMENLVKLSMEAETLRMQVKDKGQMAATLAETKTQLAEALKKLAEADATRRQLHNTIQEIKGNIRVFTRVRPLLHAGAPKTDAQGDANMLSGDEAINAIDVSADGRRLRLDNGMGSKTGFSFDGVWGPNATQAFIFEEIAPLIQSALDGYQVCLFSYGQTGSGKTHTMQGQGFGEQRGIIPRAVEKVLEESQTISKNGWQYTLEASFLEIYNELIRDLLCKDSKESDLDIKRDLTGRTTIPGLTRCEIRTINDVSTLMSKASKNRTTASTAMNDRSSRSHSVFTLNITARHPATNTTLTGSLNLCDLAGSERVSKSGVSGERLKETASINKSLSALGDVFLSLSSKSSHVPFRNSKLTYLLQPCLSGDGKTAMIVNLNPSLASAQESLCTLRFAAQVNQVEMGKPKKHTKIEECEQSGSASSTSNGGSMTARSALSSSASTSNLHRPTTASSKRARPASASTRR